MENKKLLHLLSMLLIVTFVTSSCTYNSRGISDSNARIEFEKDDVTISEQVSASA